MEREGWKTRTSIETQAARIDFLDMRGPKIAIGLDDTGTLVVLVVNGRIPEKKVATGLQVLLEQSPPFVGHQSGVGEVPVRPIIANKSVQAPQLDLLGRLVSHSVDHEVNSVLPT
jgi:hypothetical protein